MGRRRRATTQTLEKHDLSHQRSVKRFDPYRHSLSITTTHAAIAYGRKTCQAAKQEAGHRTKTHPNATSTRRSTKTPGTRLGALLSVRLRSAIGIRNRNPIRVGYGFSMTGNPAEERLDPFADPRSAFIPRKNRGLGTPTPHANRSHYPETYQLAMKCPQPLAIPTLWATFLSQPNQMLSLC